MCGIVGYLGKNDIKKGLAALKRLEYRGYDSAGLAVFDSEKKRIIDKKVVGRISLLEDEISSDNYFQNGLIATPSIYHSRWATHGKVTRENAHPHHDCQENIYLVHNGIVENYKELKEELAKEGHNFYSETDTEIICHLIEKYFEGNLEDALKKALQKIRGAYALAVIAKNDPQKLIAVRLSSPLLIGIGEGEYFVASDQNALAPYVQKVIHLDDGEVAVIEPSGLSLSKTKKLESLEIEPDDLQKRGYPHFMLKEIAEQPETIEDALSGRILVDTGLARLGGLGPVQERLKEVKRINIIACGTAYYAGLAGEYMLTEYAGLPARVDLASEFRYRKPILDKETAVLAISQSGETADTLAALREAKAKGALVLGIVNVVGSSLARETEAGIYCRAGAEIGVASTKAFTSQLTILALLTLFLGRSRQLSTVMGQRICKELLRIPGLAGEVLKKDGQIKELAEKYKNFNNFLYIGRKYNYPVALEGALKLKEISYIHAEGYGAGEMKHGPIALIDENFPTLAICPSDSVYEKTVSNIMEIKARKGLVIAVATEGNNDIKNIADDIIYIPKTLEMLTPILAVIPLQLFAYHMGVLRGCDVDRPRNLAKSVTVE
jgi:glucosamine--fructose-6-phosphate aminotransferase (isomerizing)